MEQKMLLESQSLLKKMFESEDTKNAGVISIKSIPQMLETLHLEIEIKAEEIQKQTSEVDPEGTGLVDYEAFSKVILYFLVKESKLDGMAFSDKRTVALGHFQTI